jgi:hypothetical protein
MDTKNNTGEENSNWNSGEENSKDSFQRTPVQITSIESLLCALCDDGTIWIRECGKKSLQLKE